MLAAEWSRLGTRLGGVRLERARARRKRRLTVVEGTEDDFAASVERDLANLPVVDEQDDRQRS